MTRMPPQSATQPEPQATAHSRMWRRGPAPVAAGNSIGPDGQPDYGYFGPAKSVLWPVVTHPAVILMVTSVTQILQSLEASMAQNFLDHDPVYTAAAKGRARPAMIMNRVRRTVGVLAPVFASDKPTADAVVGHLRRFHQHMRGTVHGSGQPYDAMGPEMVLYGHVTLIHAALRAYETMAFREGRPPHPLTDAERDQYFAEAAPFAVMMGAREQDVPKSFAEVCAYYESCAPQFYNGAYFMRETLAIVPPYLRPRQLNEVGDLVMNLGYLFSLLPALAAIPRPLRRLLHVPTALDPVAAVALLAVQPAFALLQLPGIGHRALSYIIGEENTALFDQARAPANESRASAKAA